MLALLEETFDLESKEFQVSNRYWNSRDWAGSAGYEKTGNGNTCFQILLIKPWMREYELMLERLQNSRDFNINSISLLFWLNDLYRNDEVIKSFQSGLVLILGSNVSSICRIVLNYWDQMMVIFLSVGDALCWLVLSKSSFNYLHLVILPKFWISFYEDIYYK